jgi:hypothetical protein
MLRIALGLCTGIMHNIHKNIHKADAYFSTSDISKKKKERFKTKGKYLV